MARACRFNFPPTQAPGERSFRLSIPIAAKLSARSLRKTHSIFSGRLRRKKALFFPAVSKTTRSFVSSHPQVSNFSKVSPFCSDQNSREKYMPSVQFGGLITGLDTNSLIAGLV